MHPHRSHLLIRQGAPNDEGRVLHITPETAGWHYVGFDVYHLAVGQSLSRINDRQETCAVLISGAAQFQVIGQEPTSTTLRHSPFDANRWALYAPMGAKWTATALAPLELAVCAAPARSIKTPRTISPADVRVEKRGTGANTRYVADFLPEDQDVADRLLVLEAITPGGSWSSYPPHKHDQDNLPTESQLEEVYYHRVRPATGFAMQRIYTEDKTLDESITVSDGDVVLVPRGYHPVGAAHGYDLYYLNAMAGPHRVWRTHVDPAHSWLLRE